MAAKQLTLPGPVVKKHNNLVRNRISIESALSGRIFASLVACIRSDDTTFKNKYSIPVKDLMPDTGGNNYQQIKAACVHLREKAALSCEARRSDDKYSDYYYDMIFWTVPVFKRITYGNGVIEAKFNDEHEIIECLLMLKSHFTQYNLIEYLRLPSVYSQRLYEILKSWVKTDTQVDIQLVELHNMLNASESFRKKYPDFRRNVLEKAHRDINEKTDLSYAWVPIKRGQAVETIRFIFGAARVQAVEKTAKETAQAKQSAKNNMLAKAAAKCIKEKAGVCTTQDNKPKVCDICRRLVG